MNTSIRDKMDESGEDLDPKIRQELENFCLHVKTIVGIWSVMQSYYVDALALSTGHEPKNLKHALKYLQGEQDKGTKPSPRLQKVVFLSGDQDSSPSGEDPPLDSRLFPQPGKLLYRRETKSTDEL